MSNGLIPEVTDQPTDETRHARLWNKLVATHLLLKKICWINMFIECDQARRFGFDDLNFVPADDILRPGPDTDKRIAGDPLATFDRFEQERGPVLSQFHIHADGCLEVCRDFANDTCTWRMCRGCLSGGG